MRHPADAGGVAHDMTLATTQAALLARMKALGLRLRRLELPAVNGHGDDGDHALHAEQRDLAFATRESVTAELAAIESALARIESGTFGACLDCGQAIPPKRLAMYPAAERDVRCQERLEFTEARLRGPDRRPSPYAEEEAD
jgi:DnaK suppressor protein